MKQWRNGKTGSNTSKNSAMRQSRLSRSGVKTITSSVSEIIPSVSTSLQMEIRQDQSNHFFEVKPATSVSGTTTGSKRSLNQLHMGEKGVDRQLQSAKERRGQIFESEASEVGCKVMFAVLCYSDSFTRILKKN